jgi:hypothetical protein
VDEGSENHSLLQEGGGVATGFLDHVALDADGSARVLVSELYTLLCAV